VKKLPLVLLSIAITSIAQPAKAELICMWTIKEPKGKSNEDFMKAPCQRKELTGTKNYTERYSAQGRVFTVEYLGKQSGLKQKVKINNKIGTASEENKYAKSMNSDDLTLDFSYDEVLPSKDMTLMMLQGVWAENTKSECKPDKSGIYGARTIAIKRDTMTRFGGESECKIEMVGKTTTVDIGMIIASCQDEEDKNRSAFSFSFTDNGRTLWWNGIESYQRCPRS
jgi:hypothetical protein